VAPLKHYHNCMSKRNHLIDILRFLAAGWVALMHFNQPVPAINNWYRNFVSLGYLGVPVFFVISGYCVYLAAEHSKGAKDFIIRRFFRIFPPYWFSILIVGLAVVLSIILLGHNDVTILPKTMTAVLETVALLVVPLTKIQVINWVYWTLVFEVFFYLIIWISLLFSRRLRSVWLIIISVLPLAMPIHEYWFFFFIKHWPEFCVGLIVYRVLHHPKTEIWQNAALLLLTIWGLFTIPLLAYIPATTIIIVLLIVVNHYCPLKETRLSQWGDYSYSIYLIHIPIGVFILGCVKQIKFVQTHLLVNLSWDLILLAVIVVLSRVMYLFIESPAISMGKKITAGYPTKDINPN